MSTTKRRDLGRLRERTAKAGAISLCGSPSFIGPLAWMSLAILAVGAAPVQAELGDLVSTFVSPTASNYPQHFGMSLATVGGNILIGVASDISNSSDIAKVYLYDGSAGGLVRTFDNPSQQTNSGFGQSVAAAGNNVLVGAPGSDGSEFASGAAYLFDGSTGALLHAFVNPAPSYNGHFGMSVAAFGNNILIGTPGDDTGGDAAGAAHMYDASSGQLIRTFREPTPGTFGFFGWSVAAIGDNVLVGAVGYNHMSGVAYLFDGSTGQLLQTFQNPTPAESESFGCSVAAVGNNVLIGAQTDDTFSTFSGAAYLFDGSTGQLLQTFLNPTPAQGDCFGHSVAAVGEDVLIGAVFDDAGAEDAGAAYLFDGSTGQLLQTFLNPTPNEADFFGSSVAALGYDILVGSPYDDAKGTDFGAVYLFEGIPEPATLAILGCGALALLRRYRRHRA